MKKTITSIFSIFFASFLIFACSDSTTDVNQGDQDSEVFEKTENSDKDYEQFPFVDGDNSQPIDGDSETELNDNDFISENEIDSSESEYSENESDVDIDLSGSPDAKIIPDSPFDGPLVVNHTMNITPENNSAIYVYSAFSGSAIWSVYSFSKDKKSFDIGAVKLNGLGEALVPHFQVNTTDFADYQPSVAVAGDKVLFAWHSDSSLSQRNLNLYYRIFNSDGTAVMDADKKLIMSLDGKPQDVNAWISEVTALPDGNFAIAGCWGAVVGEAKAFKVFIQKIAPNGDLIGNAINAYIETNAMQMRPGIASDNEGNLVVAWDAEQIEGSDVSVFYTKLAKNATETSPNPPIQAVSGATNTSSYGVNLAGSKTEKKVYLVHSETGQSPLGIKIKEVAEATSDPSGLIVGAPTGNDLNPSVAAAPSRGGAVVWFRKQTGNREQLLVHRFLHTTYGMSKKGSEVHVANGTYMLYGATINHVMDNIYFISWTQGSSPDFEVKGRFVQLD